MNGIEKNTQIAFVGLGAMGKSMARNLLKAGLPVTVFNCSSGAAQELAAEGARVASTPAELAATADVTGLCLPDTPDVERVLFGPDGLADGLRPGSVVIDFSTISAPATVEFAARLKVLGVDMLDSPVSGGPKGAAEGTLSCMIGGDDAVLARCMPVFEAVGGTFTHVGPRGAGQLCKSCNQLRILKRQRQVGEQVVKDFERIPVANISAACPGSRRRVRACEARTSRAAWRAWR